MSLLSYFDLNKRVSPNAEFLMASFFRKVSQPLPPQAKRRKRKLDDTPEIAPGELPRPSASPPPAPRHRPAAPEPAPLPSGPVPPTQAPPEETSPLLDRIVEGGRLRRSTHISLAEQLLMYFGTVVGVVFSSAVMNTSSGKTTSLSLSIPTVIVALIIAFVVIPIAFEKLTIKPDAPLVARFGLFVQHGVFWHVLFGAVGKAIAS